MKHLIMGYGEVGKAIERVLLDAGYEVEHRDKGEKAHPIPEIGQEFDVMHICYPYTKFFLYQTKNYRDYFLREGGLTIIHSTVPIGTTEQIPGAVHSPIRGVHPNLAEGIKTFVKFFGGGRSQEAAEIFKDICPTECTVSSRNTEALKLWDTTQYGWMIILEKEIHKFCEENNLDFSIVYTEANETYNDGYKILGRPEVVRPVLKHVEGPIGGHCVIQNLGMLGTVVSEIIKKSNSLL